MRTSSPHSATTGPRFPRSRRGRILLIAASATLLSAAAAGCGSDGTTPASVAATSTDTPAGPATSAGPSSGGSQTTAPPASTGPAAAPPSGASPSAQAQSAGARCTVTDLKLTLGRGDPGAGNIYFPLEFTNKTPHTCTLDGFPGVSLLRGDGSVIGKPADRQGGRGAAVKVAPGHSVQADLHTLNQGIKGDSCWSKPTLIMVYPPGSKDSMTLSTSSPVVCGATFDVSPVH